MRSNFQATWTPSFAELAMDVHRVRFVEHDPKPIHCLAFSDDSPSSPKLAVSRGDGSIEIWLTSDGVSFYKDVWVPGRTDGSVESLVWCAGRLLTSGLTGIVLEWDLVCLRPLQSLDLYGGAVWCMRPNREKTLLAVGSEDGQVRLLDISSDTLSFVRGLDKQEGRVLSLAWHPDGNYIAVGGADSIIRKLDVKTGRCVMRITLDEYKSRSTLVWDVKFLSDSTIVSADSLGKVQFWNSPQGTLIQSCPLHSADVLCLAVSEDKNTLYSAGIDQKVTRLQRVKEDRKWLKSSDVRVHSHDVRALALSSSGLIASGGVDTQLVTCPTSTFDVKSSVKHHPLPDSSRFFSVATSADVLMHQGNVSLRFWQLSTQHRLKSQASSTQAVSVANGDRLSELASPSTSLSSVGELCVNETEPAPLPHCTNGVPKNFLEIKCKGPEHILSSAVSADAVSVALSTVDQLWVYHIDHKKLNIRCVKESRLPCFKMGFTQDGHHLILATVDHGVKTVDMSTTDLENARTIHTKTKAHHPVTHFEISSDSKLVALSNTSKRITISSVETGQVVCKVPRVDGRPTVYTFNLSCDQLVFFSGTDKQLLTFNVSDRHLEVVGYLPLDRKYEGRSKLSCPSGLSPVPGREGLYAVYDNDTGVLVRRSKGSQKPATKKGKRKERSFDADPLCFRFITSNSGIVLFVGPFGSRELVLVERSWTETLSKFPPALARSQYGT